MTSTNGPRLSSSLAEEMKEVSLAQELPYWDFLEDLVILADGTHALGFKLRGVAIETLDATQINRLTEAFRSILNSLPDGFEFTFIHRVTPNNDEVLKRHAALCPEEPSLSWLTQVRVDNLQTQASADAILRTELCLVIYKRLPANFGSKVSGFFTSPRLFVDCAASQHELALKSLRQVGKTLCESLESAGIGSSPLSAKEIFSLIYEFLNPTRCKDHPAPHLNEDFRKQEFTPSELSLIPELSLSSPREQLVFSDLTVRADCLTSDGRFSRCLSLKTMPEVTHAALISKLTALPFPFTLNIHVCVPEQSKELSSLQAKRRMAHSMSISANGHASDLESEARLNSTEELLRELINTGQKIFYFQCVVLIDARTRGELERKSRTVLARVRELNGAEALSETIGNLAVWKTMLPFGNRKLCRPKRIKTDNLADFLPLYQPYDGHAQKPVCLFKNRTNGLVHYNPFDSNLPNYNTLVTGSSGAGKSFVNNLILSQYMTQKPLVYIIDVGGSYKKLCEYFGGQYIEMAPPDSSGACSAINPFLLPEGAQAPSAQKIKFLLAFLETVITDEGQGRLPKLERSLIEEAISELYATCGVDPTLSDLRSLFEKSSHPSLIQFSKVLYPWTGERAYGKLLDAPSALSLDRDFVVFDLKGLSNYPDLQSVMLLIITDFILGRVEGVKGRPKQIFMDECWEVLKNPASLHVMEYCVRTLRKVESGITFITQGLEEIVSSPIGSAILSNTATKFILLQRGDLEPVRSALKLNEQEISLIASLRRAKGKFSEAFMVQNEERAVIRIEPTPLEYWLATSDGADNRMLSDVRVKNPEKNLSECLYQLATTFPEGAQGRSV